MAVVEAGTQEAVEGYIKSSSEVVGAVGISSISANF
jgi:hypothetical protein